MQGLLACLQLRKWEVPWEGGGSTWKHAVALCWIKANAVFFIILKKFSTNIFLAKNLKIARKLYSGASS